jgi:4-diphosphocytidyl-2-C-methyl-D-erythritol kinase
MKNLISVTKSNAKINIGLNILYKRADGFHEIKTIFQEISLYDTLEFRPASNIQIKSQSLHCPTDSTNLAFKAADTLNCQSGLSKGIEITIHKSIPIGSGLGGGSSNAACTLSYLNNIWSLGYGPNRIATLGSRIGSDVPFFFTGGSAIGMGRGEILEPIKIFNNYWGVLVAPSYGVSTKWAYTKSNFSLTKRIKKINFGNFVQKSTDLKHWKVELKNDLEPAVFSAYPELGEIVDLLYKHGAFYAQMSGSGSSLYGLFESKNAAQQSLELFAKFKTFLFEPINK